MRVWSPEHTMWLERPPINEMGAEQIHDEFVTDAADRRIVTPLLRFVEGIERVAFLRDCTIEDAFTWIKDDAKARGAVGVFL